MTKNDNPTNKTFAVVRAKTLQTLHVQNNSCVYQSITDGLSAVNNQPDSVLILKVKEPWIILSNEMRLPSHRIARFNIFGEIYYCIPYVTGSRELLRLISPIDIMFFDNEILFLSIVEDISISKKRTLFSDIALYADIKNDGSIEFHVVPLIKDVRVAK